MRVIALFFLLMMLISNAQAQNINAEVKAAISDDKWSYTVINNKDSPFSIGSFYLTLNAPIKSINSPSGWDYSSDMNTYVFWLNNDPDLPYPHNIQPGQSLSGFDISSDVTSSNTSRYELTAWDLQKDDIGALIRYKILSPSTTPSNNPLFGDLNGDGKLDVQDAVLSLRIAVNLAIPTDAQKLIGDMNRDSKLDVQDSVAILKKIVGVSS